MRNLRWKQGSWMAAVVTSFLTVALAGRTARAQTQPLGLQNPIQSVSMVGGGLVATTVQGQVIPLLLSTSPRQPGSHGCPILDLTLGPINLDLLGLQVTTSSICLDITGQPGPGNLLGNLPCDIARLLDRGVPLSSVLAGLTAAQVTQLTGGLQDLLNQALGQLNAATVASSQVTTSCSILSLVLGPLDLNLLGLQVHLDNCAGGPVTLSVTAIPGSGSLLGNLLCGILGSTTLGTTLQQLLQQVIGAILGAL